jgi:hypothetical protein
MTLDDILFDTYYWSSTNASLVLGASLGIPVVGTVLASIGKGGKTDKDGRFIASSVMAVAMLMVLLQVALLAYVSSVQGRSLMQANLVLLVAPPLCLVGSALGIRLVFPLSELGSVRTVLDLLAFLAACAAVYWVLSQFRGWSVMFHGSVWQLLAIVGLTIFFLRRMYRRTFGLERPPARGRYGLD